MSRLTSWLRHEPGAHDDVGAWAYGIADETGPLRGGFADTEREAKRCLDELQRDEVWRRSAIRRGARD